jgi:urease accessory protein UreH
MSAGVSHRWKVMRSLGERPQVDLQFSCDAQGRTFVSRRYVSYPFAFTRPFHLDNEPKGMLTVVMQSTSGGVFANTPWSEARMLARR